MNKFVFMLIAFCAVGSAFGDSSEEVLEKVKSKHLKKYLSANKERLDEGLEKLDKQCPGVSDKLKDAVLTAHACNEKVDDTLTICQAIHTSTLNCSQPILKVVDDCLPQKAKGLPSLGVKSVVSLVDFFCQQTGESLLELANPCIYEDSENSAEDAECEQKVKTIAEKFEDEDSIPTQAELCTSITGLRSCIQQHTGTSCKNPKTKKVILGVFDALVAPCSHINEV